MDAKSRAVYYLNMRPRTEAQLRKYLKERGFGEEEIDEAAEEMKEYGYIDDLSFAVGYFEYGFEKGRGTLRIKHELKEKGISPEIIDMAYDELYDVPDQLETAVSIGETMTVGIDISELDYNEKQKLRAKIARRLNSRGFTADTIYSALGRLV